MHYSALTAKETIWHIGSVFEGGADKKAIFESIWAAYRIGSNAAHTGKLKRDSDTKTLEKAATLVQRALLKIITDGSIDWKSVELGLYE